MNPRQLIIFIKNPILGKVKTRLAASIGNESALKVYLKLMQHTQEVALQVDCDRHLFYDSNISEDDSWSTHSFEKKLQSNGDLGHRMEAAFTNVLSDGNSTIIIGSDCPEISPQLIEEAYNKLELVDVIIGPTHDGGYYLLGMKDLHPSLFRDIEWSSSTVFDDTIEKIKSAGLLYTQLPIRHDMDEVSTLELFPHFKP